MSYQETIASLEVDRSKLASLQHQFFADVDSLTKQDLIFIIKNMNVDFNAIIESLQKADLEKDDRTYPYCEDYGYSDQ